MLKKDVLKSININFIIFSAVLIIASRIYAFAGERMSLGDTPYYYEYNEDNNNYTVYDSSGKIISENEYDVLKTGGGKIIARMLKYNQHYGILDKDFNIILEPRFSQINFNENTQAFECLTWGEGPDKIEFFNTDMQVISQPRDIIKAEGTDFYYERVIDENAEINDGYVGYYICDKKGNRLSSARYVDIKNVSGKIEVTDENGNISTFNDSAQFITLSTASQWAQNSIRRAIEADIVPKELQNNYTKNINRQEFCRLAVKTYMAKTGYDLDYTMGNPFEDFSDEYVTAAYGIGIVSGTGENQFSPDNAITRQEAAVMLSNLAKLLNIKKEEVSVKYIDENYFAGWAKESIYNISAVKSGNTYVMVGTEENKFSPWMNYTREQAIATMLRLYDCKEMPEVYDGQYCQPIGGEWLYCDGTEYDEVNDKLFYTIYRVKKNGSEEQALFRSYEGCYINFISNDKIYYTSDNKFYTMESDGTNQIQISKNDIDNAADFTVLCAYDEKYKYYLKDDWSTGIKSPDRYITRSDHQGNNEIRLCDMPVQSEPILYGGYIFACSGNSILRIDENGDYINILEDADLDLWDILKIENGLIYYRAISEAEISNTAYMLTPDRIYAINIDGTDNRLIFSPS